MTGTSGCARAAAAAQRWKAGPCGGLCSCGGSTLRPSAACGHNHAAAQPALRLGVATAQTCGRAGSRCRPCCACYVSQARPQAAHQFVPSRLSSKGTRGRPPGGHVAELMQQRGPELLRGVDDLAA